MPQRQRCWQTTIEVRRSCLPRELEVGLFLSWLSVLCFQCCASLFILDLEHCSSISFTNHEHPWIHQQPVGHDQIRKSEKEFQGRWEGPAVLGSG